MQSDSYRNWCIDAQKILRKYSGSNEKRMEIEKVMREINSYLCEKFRLSPKLTIAFQRLLTALPGVMRLWRFSLPKSFFLFIFFVRFIFLFNLRSDVY